MDPKGIRIFTMIAGREDFAVSAILMPHDTIAAYFKLLKKRLVLCGKPNEFSAAYSLVHTTGGPGLAESDPDCIALGKGDPVVTARYLTPAAQLDPNKTVVEYFGEGFVPWRAHAIIVWTAASHAIDRMGGLPYSSTDSDADSTDSDDSWATVDCADTASASKPPQTEGALSSFSSLWWWAPFGSCLGGSHDRAGKAKTD